jgi:hypothetical protein
MDSVDILSCVEFLDCQHDYLWKYNDLQADHLYFNPVCVACASGHLLLIFRICIRIFIFSKERVDQFFRIDILRKDRIALIVFKH